MEEHRVFVKFITEDGTVFSQTFVLLSLKYSHEEGFTFLLKDDMFEDPIEISSKDILYINTIKE